MRKSRTTQSLLGMKRFFPNRVWGSYFANVRQFCVFPFPHRENMPCNSWRANEQIPDVLQNQLTLICAHAEFCSDIAFRMILKDHHTLSSKISVSHESEHAQYSPCADDFDWVSVSSSNLFTTITDIWNLELLLRSFNEPISSTFFIIAFWLVMSSVFFHF